MSETTTAPTAEAGAGIGPDPSRAPLPAPTASSELAIHAGQRAFNEEQVAVLRHMGLEHATEPDLKVFWHYCQRTGLDPFTRQVYMIGRDTKVRVREVNPETGNERTVEQRVEKFTIQVGIDGWRLIGNRAAKREGARVGHRRPLYAGADGVWTSVWSAEEPPVACEYTLEIDGVEVTSICYFDEYVQQTWVDGKGMVPNSMWRKMPRNQLAKCAEGLSWRKAFPADYSGIVLEDAAQPDLVVEGEVVDGPAPAKAAPKRAKGAERNRERAHKAATKGAKSEPAPAAEQEDPDPRRKWVNSMFRLFAECGLDQRDDQLIAIAELGKLDALPEHRDAIDDETLRSVVHKLAQIVKAAEDREAAEADVTKQSAIEAAVDDMLRSWEYRQANAADEAQQ